MAHLIRAVGVVALFPVAAHAQYLDPGAGSILIQAVIAVAVGAAAAVKIYWRRISSFASRLSSRRSKSDADT